MTKYIRALSFVILFISLLHSEPNYYTLIDSAVSLTNTQQYSKAIDHLKPYTLDDHESALHRITVQSFIAIIYIGRFDDLGDTTDIFTADSLLHPCEKFFKKTKNDPETLFWYNLIRLQRAFVMELRGKSISAALQIRSASNELAKLTQNRDAQAFSAIYHFYIEKSLSWIPFSNAQNFIKPLKIGGEQSRWFKHYFINTLSWVYFEEERYLEAIQLMTTQLTQFPHGRVSYQTLGDLYAAHGNIQKALEIYHSSLLDYATIAPGSLRHLCALANLALLYSISKDNDLSKEFLSQFNKATYKPMHKWLPPTLLESLEEQGLI
ncbi:MAG: hypothetical protein OCD01_12230 [Fibrobacterales bacterium]